MTVGDENSPCALGGAGDDAQRELHRPDDTERVQSCVDSGEAIPAGTYLLRRPLVAP